MLQKLRTIQSGERRSFGWHNCPVYIQGYCAAKHLTPQCPTKIIVGVTYDEITKVTTDTQVYKGHIYAASFLISAMATE